MKKMVLVVLSLLISINTYCQNKARHFYIDKMPLSANKGVFRLSNKKNSIGVVIGKRWYRINGERSNSQSMYCRTFDYKGKKKTDTLNVSIPDSNIDFKLILAPHQNESFEKNTRYLHMSHMSHRSHYSHFSGK